RVSWDIDKKDDKSHVHFVWRERSVGPLPPSRRRGFGSELMERFVPGMLDGKAQLTVHEDGIEYVLDFAMLEGAQAVSLSSEIRESESGSPNVAGPGDRACPPAVET